MVESLEKRLGSYSVAELRKFVSDRNIKNYWKGDMSTKETIILEMVARKEIYDDIPMKGARSKSKAPAKPKGKGKAPAKPVYEEGELIKTPKGKPNFRVKKAKKERSAKQLANDKRFGEMAKKRAKERREKKGN